MESFVEVSAHGMIIISLVEIIHISVLNIVAITLLFGGFFITIKFFLYFIFFTLFPKAVIGRTRSSNSVGLCMGYIYILLFFYIIFFIVTKFIICLV